VDFAAFVERGFKVKSSYYFPDGVLRYCLDGTVKSGHNDTTLGNSLVNAMIAYDSLMRLGYSAEILVAGDDLLVALDENPVGLHDMEATYGIKPVSRVFRDPLDVSFISGVFLRGSTGWLFLPKLGRLLARLWWTVNPPPPRRVNDYRASVVRGLRSVAGNVPLYCDFLREIEGGEYNLGTDYYVKLANWGGSEVGPETTRGLCDRYHLNFQEFDELSEYLRNLPMAPVSFSNALVRRVLLVDLADLVDRPLVSDLRVVPRQDSHDDSC